MTTIHENGVWLCLEANQAVFWHVFSCFLASLWLFALFDVWKGVSSFHFWFFWLWFWSPKGQRRLFLMWLQVPSQQRRLLDLLFLRVVHHLGFCALSQHLQPDVWSHLVPFDWLVWAFQIYSLACLHLTCGLFVESTGWRTSHFHLALEFRVEVLEFRMKSHQVLSFLWAQVILASFLIELHMLGLVSLAAWFISMGSIESSGCGCTPQTVDESSKCRVVFEVRRATGLVFESTGLPWRGFVGFFEVSRRKTELTPLETTNAMKEEEIWERKKILRGKQEGQGALVGGCSEVVCHLARFQLELHFDKLLSHFEKRKLPKCRHGWPQPKAGRNWWFAAWFRLWGAPKTKEAVQRPRWMLRASCFRVPCRTGKWLRKPKAKSRRRNQLTKEKPKAARGTRRLLSFSKESCKFCCRKSSRSPKKVQRKQWRKPKKSKGLLSKKPRERHPASNKWKSTEKPSGFSAEFPPVQLSPDQKSENRWYEAHEELRAAHLPFLA